MKLDQTGKNLCKFGMHVFLLFAIYLLGDIQRPFIPTAPHASKVFITMMTFIFSFLFGAVAYLTELSE